MVEMAEGGIVEIAVAMGAAMEVVAVVVAVAAAEISFPKR